MQPPISSSPAGAVPAAIASDRLAPVPASTRRPAVWPSGMSRTAALIRLAAKAWRKPSVGRVLGDVMGAGEGAERRRDRERAVSAARAAPYRGGHDEGGALAERLGAPLPAGLCCFGEFGDGGELRFDAGAVGVAEQDRVSAPGPVREDVLQPLGKRRLVVNIARLEWPIPGRGCMAKAPTGKAGESQVRSFGSALTPARSRRRGRVVLVVAVPMAARIGAGFRVERRLRSRVTLAAQPADHVGDHVVGADEDRARDELDGQMAVAEVPGDADQLRRDHQRGFRAAAPAAPRPGRRRRPRAASRPRRAGAPRRGRSSSSSSPASVVSAIRRRWRWS